MGVKKKKKVTEVVKNNFKNLFIGLSGGIDSALVLALANDTFDKKNIT